MTPDTAAAHFKESLTKKIASRVPHRGIITE